MDRMHKNSLNNAHYFLGVATAYARAARGILYELHEFQRSIADKRHK